MKKTILIPIALVIFATTASQAFFGALLGNMVANKMKEVATSVIVNAKNGYLKNKDLSDINSHLWSMHENNQYSKDYKHYLTYLEDNTNNIDYLDTVACVYKDNGQIKKARKIYETRLLPNSKGTASEEHYYQKYLDNFASKSDLAKMKKKEENEAKRQAQIEKNKQIEEENARIEEQNRINLEQIEKNKQIELENAKIEEQNKINLQQVKTN